YVSVDGSDDNSGAADAPVATIAHAIEIAENGKIVILAGEYTINATLVINKDLDIAGEGNVVIDGNSTRIIENTANLNLTNLVFTNAKSTYGSVLADNGNTIIDNCTFYGNAATATRSANIINNMAGTMVIDNSKFYNNVASRGVIASQAETALIVNNSEFFDNDMTSFTNAYGIIYSTSADAVVENTVFRNNKVQNGGAIYATKSTSATAGSLEVINCTFEDNMAYKGTGGAIFASGTLTVDIYDSTFINNTAVKSDLGVGGNGGAIYTTGSSDVTVINSVLIDNAGDADAGIYASGNTFDISNSIILAKDGDINPALNVNDCTVTANDNFWGDNSKANTNADVERWIIMTANYDEDSGVLAVSFDKTNSTSGTIADYAGVLPDGLTVAVISSSGKLDEVLPVISGQVSTTYVKDDEDRFIKVTCSNAEVIIKFMIKPDVIYVAMNGSDDNYGTIDDPVATIAHAVEIAEKGKIIILEGNYTTDYLGIISGDLNITGEGRVVIDAQNNNRILYVGTDGNVTLQNLIMINGCDSEESGALLGNSNILTLINCTLANSTSGEHNGGAIYNIGKLTIINSTFANNTAKEGGAIWSNYGLGKDAEITIIDSIFENNIATGSDNFGGGAIFAQQLTGLTISGTTFIENQALSTSSGGAIFLSHITDDLTITDSKFIANHANGQEDVGGGAIYMVGTSNYERKGKLTITNTLFEENTADSNGAAIYARATTVNVANSVIFANKDAAGFAVFGYKTEQVSPSITLNDNWWGTNDDPSDFVGGNRNYKPTISRWVILTATNDTPIVEGNNVKITVSLDTYTDGETNGTLSTPITIPRDVIIETTFETIEGVLENGEFTTDYVIPADLKEIDVYVDIEDVVLYKYKEETTVEIENITAIKGDTATINAVVKTIAGDNVTGGEVEVYFGDDLVATIPVIEGVASQEVEINKDYGVYTILAKFIDTTGELLDSEATATLTVIGYNLTVKEDNYGDYGSKMTVPANFTDNNGVPVEGVEIIMIIGDNNYTEVTDSMGQVEFDISDVLPGTYNATIKVKEYEIYKVADVYANVVINKLNSTIVVDPVITIFPDENIFAILVDNEGNGIGNASVIITINNESTALISDENGQVTLPIKDFAPGTYPAAISYEGDSIYNPSEANTEVIVHVDTSISVLHDEAAKELIATLINNHTGDGINDAEVVINVGGENYTVKTNSSGKAKVSIADLDAGPYSATVTYEGSVEYNPSNATIGFYIKADTVVSAVYDEVANEIVATLIDNATGEPVGYADVIISVGGENYTVKTNSSGIAVVSVADLVAGPYTADVAYEGSANYNPSAASVDFIVKADTVVSAVYDDDAKELTVSLTDNVTGDAIAGADVVITVGSDVFNVVTDDNGQAVQALDLVAGAYTADVAYDGSVMYNPSAASVDFIVKADTVVSAVYDDDAKELVATLINNVTGQPIKGGTVRFNVDGVKYTVKSDAKGQAKISTADLAPGTYTATVSYKGNTKYNPSATTVDMVVKLNAVIIVEDLFVEYGGDAEVVATLMDLDAVQPIAGADITFNINGESYNATTDDNGQAKVTVSGLAPDTYTATVSYEGDDTYKSISEEFTIVVNKMSTSISAVYNAETNEFIATLINTETGAGIKGATVVMYLNGAKTNVKTDKNGQAIFAVDDADLTAYHAAFSYGGNFKYLKSTTSINAVENKTTTTLSTVYDKETGEIVATLTNTATGAFIKGANVVITVNGVKNVVKTDKNGQSKVLIEDLDAGQYSVSSSYGGNSKYAKTTTNINIVKFDSEGDL
ncbi:Ig-like domain repeat protein, partial [Methanobrevibacter sp.]|uniref:Ig-like domain repeat protein n=1 Tax=Methanobrevibacter sp. TaxID=66852 RepID=UPI0025FF2EB2